MTQRLIVFLVALLAVRPAAAHHAFAADYEKGNEGTITGTITEVMFRNPHARYYMEVETEDGGTELWDLETLNLMMLGRMGWKRDTIRVGDRVTVTGILGRNNTRRMSIVTVTLPGGRTISPFRSNTQTNVELNATDAPDDDMPWVSLAANVSPGIYELDEAHAYVTFAYSHLGLSHPVVQFQDFDAILRLDGRTMSNSRVDVTIDAGSIDSGVAELDEHLSGNEFFDVASYPEIRFRSRAFEELSANTGRLHGDLTVRDVSRPIVLDVVINEASMNRMTRKEMIGFSASGAILRSEYGLDAYSRFVGDELMLDIQVEFQRADRQPDGGGQTP